MIQKGTVVRHLVLPGHTRDSMAVLRWLANDAPKGIYVSLLFQYTPIGDALPPPLNRRLTQRECDKMIDYALSLGIEDGYMQERSSGHTRYIPAFDLTGVHNE
jgi:putative pyruvate formate lyase activating enzyme